MKARACSLVGVSRLLRSGAWLILDLYYCLSGNAIELQMSSWSQAKSENDLVVYREINTGTDAWEAQNCCEHHAAQVATRRC